MMSDTRAAPGGVRRPAVSWIGGLSCGLVLMVTPATILLLVVALAPTAFVRLLDDTKNRGVVRPVLLCNMTAAIGPVVRLWRAGPPNLGRAVSILSEPRVLCIAWLAGAAAWVGSEVLTLLAQQFLIVRDRQAAARLTGEIEKLREEWDPQP